MNRWATQKLIFILYTAFLICLFLYSFTQIDLSLTFSRITFFRNLVKSFQYIGYFNRPVSTYLYIVIVAVYFIFYSLFLRLGYKRTIDKKVIWRILLVTTGVLVFSYNTFSYDLFNYIFDAKIITHYHQSPYFHKALDYPGDPMLSFMHWTQRTYPYGPAWLVLTVPLSFLGLQLFLPTFFLFKGLMAASYLGCLYFIGKILRKLKPERDLFGLVFFGLNPLIIIESLVSAHLDIVMMFFALWSVWLLIDRRYGWALLVLLFSAGIKFASIFLLPIFIVSIIWHSLKKHLHWQTFSFFSIVLLIIPVVIESLRTNFQPWYLIVPLSLATFLCDQYYVLIPSLIISFFALFTYIPFLFTGNWDAPIPQYLFLNYLLSYGVSAAAVVFAYFIRRLKKYESRIKAQQ